MHAQRESAYNVVEQLSREVRKLETAGRFTSNGQSISTGCEALDACLPNRGYTPGSVVEYLRMTPACGASYLAYAAAASAMKKTDGFLVIVDTQHSIYPPALLAHDIDLQKVVFVQPESLADTLWTVDQALRTPAVAAVIGEVEKVDDRTARRFQLAAESGGGLALLLRSAAARRQPSWAEVQWLVRSSPANRRGKSPVETHPGIAAFESQDSFPETLFPHRSPGASHQTSGRGLQAKLVRSPGGMVGRVVHLAIDSLTGAIKSTEMHERNRHEQTATVRLASELASPKSPSRPAAAG